MDTARIIEIRLLAAQYPGNRSTTIITELCDEVERLWAAADKRSKTRAKRESFDAPDILEVVAEFERLGMGLESRGLAQQYMAHYESNGWRVGRNKMVSWKAACVTWKKRRIAERGATVGAGRSPAPQIKATVHPRL